MALNLLITAFDHELYRFLGLRLGPNFLAVYADPTTMADSLFLNVLRGDRGGPFLSPLLCVAAPALYLWWSIRLVRRRTRARPRAPLRPRGRPSPSSLLPLATGLIGYSLAHARFRLSRLEPALFAAIRDFAWSYEDDTPPGDPAALARAWQAEWLAGSTDTRLALPRTPTIPSCASPSRPPRRRRQERWNVAHHPARIGARRRDRPSPPRPPALADAVSGRARRPARRGGLDPGA